jgi:hypothetical protein
MQQGSVKRTRQRRVRFTPPLVGGGPQLVEAPGSWPLRPVPESGPAHRFKTEINFQLMRVLEILAINLLPINRHSNNGPSNQYINIDMFLSKEIRMLL